MGFWRKLAGLLIGPAYEPEEWKLVGLYGISVNNAWLENKQPWDKYVHVTAMMYMTDSGKRSVQYKGVKLRHPELNNSFVYHNTPVEIWLAGGPFPTDEDRFEPVVDTLSDMLVRLVDMKMEKKNVSDQEN